MERERSLRERLVTHLQRAGVLSDRRIADAIRSVPRHRFLPDCTVDDAYADRAVAIKESDGVVISSVSQPGMIAQMLDLLSVEPGDRVFEIGTGSGYTSALIAELTGPRGSVVTVDIEPDLVESANARFAELGYTWNEARVADGRVRDNAVAYDRILVTARANDIEAAWWNALRDGGRIVVPLEIGFGGERVVGFVREGARLRSIASYPCAFIAMRSDAQPQASSFFFRDAEHRYDIRSGHTSLQIIAVPRAEADPSLLESADTVVARPSSVFAVTVER